MLNYRRLFYASGAIVLVAAGGALAMTVPSAPALKDPAQAEQGGQDAAPAPSPKTDATPEQGPATEVSTRRQRGPAAREAKPVQPGDMFRAAHAPSGREKAAVIETRVPLMLGVTY
jgi:hypothetical protein